MDWRDQFHRLDFHNDQILNDQVRVKAGLNSDGLEITGLACQGPPPGPQRPNSPQRRGARTERFRKSTATPGTDSILASSNGCRRRKRSGKPQNCSVFASAANQYQPYETFAHGFEQVLVSSELSCEEPPKQSSGSQALSPILALKGASQ